MQSWMQRHLTAVLGTFVALIALAFVLIVLLFTQLRSTRDDLDATQADLERVEAGAALFASQVQGFQEQLVALEPTVSAGIDDAIARARDVQLVDARVQCGDRREPADQHRDRDRPDVHGADQDVDPHQREPSRRRSRSRGRSG